MSVGTQLMTAPGATISNPSARVSLREQFANWLYRATMDKDGIPNGAIISSQRAANQIQKIKSDGNAVLLNEVGDWIAYSRLYFEKTFQCTLWNVRGRGWRASTKIETAKYYGKSVRKTIAWADRTRQLQTIVERKYVPYAIAEVIGKAEGGIKSLSGMRKRFLEQYGLYQKDEQKQLERTK